MLKRACIWTLALFLATPLTAQDANDIASSELDAAGLRPYWQIELKLADDQRLTALYLVDDQVYAATNDGFAYALDARTGVLRWMKSITRKGYQVWRPTHADGNRVIFATPTTVSQYDRDTGEGIEQTRLTFPGGTPAVSDGSRFFVGSVNARLYAFDVRQPLFNWKVTTAGPVISAPAVGNNNVYFASDNGMVYCCTAANKILRWRSRTYGGVLAPLTLDRNGVYVPSQDNSLYLFSPDYGGVRWRARFSGPLYEAPAVTEELAFQYCPDDGLGAVETEALEPVAERIRWILPRGRRLLSLDEQRAFVQARDERVLVARLSDGEVTETIATPGYTLGDASIDETALYIGHPLGQVYCARLRGAPVATRQELREALRPAAAERAAQEAEQAAAETDEEEIQPVDVLGTDRKPPPIGGKSKVSKQFGEGGSE